MLQKTYCLCVSVSGLFHFWSGGGGRNEVKNVVRSEQGVPKNVCRGEQYPHPDQKKSCKGLFSRQKKSCIQGVGVGCIISLIFQKKIENDVWGGDNWYTWAHPSWIWKRTGRGLSFIAGNDRSRGKVQALYPVRLNWAQVFISVFCSIFLKYFIN